MVTAAQIMKLRGLQVLSYTSTWLQTLAAVLNEILYSQNVKQVWDMIQGWLLHNLPFASENICMPPN